MRRTVEVGVLETSEVGSGGAGAVSQIVIENDIFNDEHDDCYEKAEFNEENENNESSWSLLIDSIGNLESKRNGEEWDVNIVKSLRVAVANERVTSDSVI